MRLKNTLFIFIFFFQNLYVIAQYPASLESILHHLPEWKMLNQEVKIENIEGGLTNQNFKVIFPNNSYFIRTGSQNAHLLGLDSEREYFCTKEAAALGIAPHVLFYDSESHIMVMPFIESLPIKKDLITYRRVLSLLRQLHNSEIKLSNTFCPYDIIYNYYQHAVDLRHDQHVPLSSYLLSIVEEIRQVAPSYRNLVPCHLDLYSKNFLDDGNKIWIIDWEYSAMADPLYDLATLASADFLSLQEMQEILQIYLEKPTPQDFAYFYLMTILVDMRWAFWSLIQAEASQIKAPYLDYVDYFFQQIILRFNHPIYRNSLALLQAKKQE